MKELIIDFETVDYGLQEGIGPGWPWGGVKVIHCGVKMNDEPAYIIEDMAKLIELVEEADFIVAHNAQYEAGILHHIGCNLKGKKIYCTKLAAKFIDSNKFSYTLDNLALEYLNESKSIKELFLAANECNVIAIPEGFSEVAKSEKPADINRVRAFKTRWKNTIYNNLDRMDTFSDVVKDYCKHDVELTYKLFRLFRSRLDMDIFTEFSKLINVCTDMRSKGVGVNISEVYTVHNFIRSELVRLEKELYSTYGYVNYNSPLQVRPWAMGLGLEPFLKNGKKSFGKEWVDMHRGEPVIDLYENVKKHSKCLSFTDTIIKHEKHGRLHPELVIMQAKTGRFACVAPNVQQIPARDPVLGPKLRSLFIPDQGQDWYSLDFSAQEPRLQIHYASCLGIDSATELAAKYNEDPHMDSHQAVCDIINANSKEQIDRKQAKTINLGLSYGMGKDKLAAALGVPVAKAVSLKKLYNKYVPFLDQLSNKCKNTIKERGSIRTIGGRAVVVDEGFEYKGINALIQGSAFDQIAAAMIQMHSEGIVPVMCVHDELDLSCDEKTALRVKEIMETCIDMRVPSIAELNKGKNWGETK